MSIIEVIKFIRDARHQHFISVSKRVWKNWGLLVRILVWTNKRYVPCKIYRKRYKFLQDIVVVGLKWNGKNVKRRVNGFAKEFLQENKKSKCIYCGCNLDEKNATTDHIIPISEGGNNSQVNLIVCCFKCNNERGNLNFYDYLKIKNPENKVKYF